MRWDLIICTMIICITVASVLLKTPELMLVIVLGDVLAAMCIMMRS
jgi:hypothetical protein